MCGPNIPTTCTAELPGDDGPRGAAKRLLLSVVVPVFDNEESLRELHERLSRTLEGLDAAAEIVYVNDGSRDGSLDVLRELPALAGRVTVADLERNFGQSAAVMAGFSLARGDVLVTIDADLENDPRDIPLLVDAVRRGADLACGRRESRHAPLVTRRGSSWVANQLVGNALNIELRDWGCGLNAVRSNIARSMVARDPMPRLPKIEAAMLATRITEVPVAYSVRRHGRSGYTIGRLARFAASFLHDFSIRRTFRRIVAKPSTNRGAGGENGVPRGRAATIRTVSLSILCGSILSAAALVVRFTSTLLRRRPTSTTFRIREVIVTPSRLREGAR